MSLSKTVSRHGVCQGIIRLICLPLLSLWMLDILQTFGGTFTASRRTKMAATFCIVRLILFSRGPEQKDNTRRRRNFDKVKYNSGLEKIWAERSSFRTLAVTQALISEPLIIRSNNVRKYTHNTNRLKPISQFLWTESQWSVTVHIDHGW